VIHVRLYADAMQLNWTGSKKSWGVYMYIGNIPPELRDSRKKKGGAVHLGNIPEVRAVFLSHTGDLDGVHRSLENRRTQTRLSPTTVPEFTTRPY